MLDQRLVRENPELVAQALGRRGIEADLKSLQIIAQRQKDLQKERSELQAKGNLIGKEYLLRSYHHFLFPFMQLILRLEKNY